MAKKVTHSEKFATVKSYVVRGLWDKRRADDAVDRGWITAAEYKEITGEDHAN